MIKKIILLTTTLLLGLAAFSQTQQGYVKTKGRLDNTGMLIPGSPLSEVTIKVKNRNVVMSDKSGSFAFPMPDKIYYLENVTKNGYVLVDPDILTKQYAYSSNKLVIALETTEQQEEEKMDNFQKINTAQQKQITKLREEVKQLKEENKLTEEEYEKRLKDIANMQKESQKLVEEMAERYSKIDYDQLNEFDRQISTYILNGELKKADSLLNTKGDLDERAENLKALYEANAKEKNELEKRDRKLKESEALALKERDNLANDYYHKFEIYKLQHKNDTAAYFLEWRAMLDTTNMNWQAEAGAFIKNYLSDYDKAMAYYQRALRQAYDQFGRDHEKTATYYSNIGAIHSRQNQFDKALDAYNTISVVYISTGQYDKALEYCQLALKIRESNFGENDSRLASSYNNIGSLYYRLGQYEKAVEYLKKSLDIRIASLEKDDPELGYAYNNLAMAYANLGEFDKAEEYMLQGLEIRRTAFGENHPAVAWDYHNIGYINHQRGEYDTALVYHQKALEIREAFYKKPHPDIANSYKEIGVAYYRKLEPDKALEYFQKCYNIRLSIYGEDHPETQKVKEHIEFAKAMKADLEKKE